MEEILQSITAAGYPQLDGRGLALFRHDSLSESFPDVWRLIDGKIVRQYVSHVSRDGMAATVLRSGKPLLVADILKARGISPALPENIRSFLALPVHVQELPWGVLYVNSPEPDHFDQSDLVFFEALARQIGLLITATRSENPDGMQLATVRALAATVDAKDQYTQHHSTNVSFYARRLAREMKLDPAEIRRIDLAALLHDIGKIAIPDQILQKPGKLLPEERRVIETHAAIGADILAEAPHLGHLVPLVRHHHENYDGSGYPDGLKRSEIPLGAAIISLADAFDTMTTRRVYREARTLDEAMAEVRRCAGTQFDPDVVRAMESLVERARSAREVWLIALGTGLEGPAPVPAAASWQGILDPERWVRAQGRDPLDFLVEARQIQIFDELPPMLERSGELLLNFWDADGVQIYLVNRERGTLDLALNVAPGEGAAVAALFGAEDALPMARGLLGWAALTNQGITVPDARYEPRWPYARQFGEGPVSVLIAPVTARGAAVGVIQLVAAGENRFGRLDVKVLKIFGSLLGQTIDHIQTARETRERFCTDALTGIPNADFLPIFLERQQLAGLMAAAFLDGDDLKEINDRYGHEAGDLIIQHIARCCSACLRPEDVLVRYAGDEFMLFFPGLTLPEACAQIEQIRMTVSETPVELPDGDRIHVSVSCGVTEVDMALGAHRALRAAVQAMHNAKRTGKNRVWTAGV